MFKYAANPQYAANPRPGRSSPPAPWRPPCHLSPPLPLGVGGATAQQSGGHLATPATPPPPLGLKVHEPGRLVASILQLYLAPTPP